MVRLVEVDTQFLSISKSEVDKRPKHIPIRMITAKVCPFSFLSQPSNSPELCIFIASILPATQRLIDRTPLSLRCVRWGVSHAYMFAVQIWLIKTLQSKFCTAVICELILFSDQIVGRPNDCTVFSAETAQIEQQWIDRSVACLSRGLVRYRELALPGLSACLPSLLLFRIKFYV